MNDRTDGQSDEWMHTHTHTHTHTCTQTHDSSF